MTRSPAKTHTIILLSLWGLAFLGVLYLGNQARKDVKIARSATGFHLGEPETIHTKGLSAESQLLLYGDPTQESNDARWKASPIAIPRIHSSISSIFNTPMEFLGTSTKPSLESILTTDGIPSGKSRF